MPKSTILKNKVDNSIAMLKRDGMGTDELNMNNVKLSKLPMNSSMEIRKLREDFSILESSYLRRQLDKKNLNDFIQKDKEWRENSMKLNKMRADKNVLSKQINKDRNNTELLAKAKELDNQISDKTKESRDIEEMRDNLMLSLANVLDSEISDTETIALGYSGVPRVAKELESEFKDKYPGVKYTAMEKTKTQYDIIREYGLVDEDKGSELAGSRFYYKLNELVTLTQALALYATRKLAKMGFSLIEPPYLVRKFVEERATTLDAFEETLYKINGEELYLIPTAEHPIAAYNNKEVFKETDLPIHYAGYSPAFRKEAGAHGKDTKGIYRNHHFNKVEQYVICTPEQAEAEINLLIRNQMSLLRDLELPCRAIVVPSYDMDKKAIIQVDVEGWFPGQNRYGELGSHGYMGSWQGIRLNTKYTQKSSTNLEYVHTIYGTMVPVERTLACILENSLGDDGIIRLPKILADMIGVDTINPR